MIYKICSREAWVAAQELGEFRGAAVDVQDGFIHFSAADQVRETAAKHFSGQGGLVLLEVNAAALGAALRWEVSRGGARFPHLYATLRTADVARVIDLPRDPGGAHVFPAEIA